MGHHSEAFIGIDTSRDAVAIADGGRSGVEVQHQLERSRLHDGQFFRLRASEDTARIDACAACLRFVCRSVAGHAGWYHDVAEYEGDLFARFPGVDRFDPGFDKRNQAIQAGAPCSRTFVVIHVPMAR